MNATAAAKRAWDRVWFRDETTTPLEVIRIGLGTLMLITYGLMGPQDLVLLYSDAGFFSKEVLLAYGERPYYLSVFYYASTNWQLYLCHIVFVLSFAAFSLGWHTPIAKWLVLIGHLSYMNGNPMAWYGVDSIIASIVFILCLAPIGAGLSLDRRRAKQSIERIHRRAASADTVTSQWAFACTRLIQIQMAALFFYSALSKVDGTMWQDGSALWYAIHNNEIAVFPPDFFAAHFWVGQVLTWATVVFEFAYVILIWPKATRAITLLGAILLHLGIVVIMGMPYFGFAMIVGHMAFLRHEWLHALGGFRSNHVEAMQHADP